VPYWSSIFEKCGSSNGIFKGHCKHDSERETKKNSELVKEIKSRMQDVQASEEALTKRRFFANRKIRMRRVKCDEKQPICSRCKSFGVVCDGYPQMLKKHVIDLTLGRCLKLLPKPRIMEPLR
jgi:hypothetical protein